MRLLVALFSTVLLLLVIAVPMLVGEVLTRPAQSEVGPPPAALHAKAVRLPVAGSFVAGWFSRGVPGTGAVLLLHSLRADRRQMLERATFLHATGYSVLLIDLQGHGESPGERITFGVREAHGVEAALRYLEEALPGERVGVVAASLGAAAFVLAKAAPSPKAVVLESLYPTIREAIANRIALRLGPPLGRFLAPMLLWQLPLRLGISESELNPIDAVQSQACPVLVISGAADKHTTATETRRLFDAITQPKQLWLVEGAAHADLFQHAPATYQETVLTFLRSHLHQ